MCALGHHLPFFIRYAAHFRFDVIWLDLEHRAMDQREIQSLLAFCRLADIDCVAPPPTLDRSRLYRYLEDGAAGFTFPLVSDAETARYLVNAVKFPSLGNRGLDGFGLDSDFGVEAWRPGNTYTRDANEQTFIAVQSETLEPMGTVEQIAAVPGVDCFFWVQPI
jgi:4-hydroxy-2-oxoheptanedioate aldolase